MRILISGGGIAGPAAGFWLGRAGHEVTVVEKDSAPRTGGQAVDIRGAARDVLDRMGLSEAVRAARIDEVGFAYVNRRGRVGARMRADDFGGEGIVADLEVFRGDLSRVLRDAAAPYVTERFGDSITHIGQTSSGVEVAFESSVATTFDLVIGADGTRSTTRSRAFGTAATESVHPLGAVMAYFSTPIASPLPRWFLMCSAPGRRMLALRPSATGGSMALLSYAVDRGSVGAARGSGLPRDRAAREVLFRAVFADAGWLAPEILAAMTEAPDLIADDLAQVRLESWSSGRVVLLGDAAWSPSPLTGMGTSAGLVGALVLADSLAAVDGIEPALAAYERRMRPYIARTQAMPPGGVHGYLPATPLAIAVRNSSMRGMRRWPMKAVMKRVFAHTNEIELPAVAEPARGSSMGR